MERLSFQLTYTRGLCFVIAGETAVPYNYGKSHYKLANSSSILRGLQPLSVQLRTLHIIMAMRS